MTRKKLRQTITKELRRATGLPLPLCGSLVKLHFQSWGCWYPRPLTEKFKDYPVRWELETEGNDGSNQLFSLIVVGPKGKYKFYPVY